MVAFGKGEINQLSALLRDSADVALDIFHLWVVSLTPSGYPVVYDFGLC
jgi:hypothetical protein